MKKTLRALLLVVTPFFRRRRVVIDAHDADHWHDITRGDHKTLRQVSAEPIICRKGRILQVIDRGAR